MSQDLRNVTIERDFAHPADRLWRALTQPHLIAEWLMKNDFVAEVGHRFNLSGEWGGVLDCEVLTLKSGRELSYRWDYRHEDPAFDLRSVVTFTLEPVQGGTRLTMVQTGFRPEQKQASGGARYGWNANFGKLETLLASMD